MGAVTMFFMLIIIMSISVVYNISEIQSLGHDAGDELLCGAAECISNIFGKLGNVYRKGGDEFAAIVYCDKKEMTLLVEAFENELKGWSGDKVKELTISLGWICSSDYPDLSIDELEQKADELMYKNKTQYYISTGIDRRKY